MRKLAREAAFKLIYQNMFTSDDEQSLALVFEELEETDKEYVQNIYNLYKKNKTEVEKVLSENIKGYELNRVYKIDVALLSLGITEIKFSNETPAPIVINEIIDISKRYSTDKSYAFINAVMSAILKG